MELTAQKRLAAEILKCSKKKIAFNPERLDDIKESITKVDIRGLIKEGAIIKKPIRGVSRFRARKIAIQKSKGKRRGHGSRKGKCTAREPKKMRWMAHVRLQRAFIKELKEKSVIEHKIYRNLYSKVGGGFFRSKRHIKQYLEEHKLGKK